MENEQRREAADYLRAARGGLARPEKFSAESLFQLTALAIEGFWLSFLEAKGEVPAHRAFRDLIKAAEAVGPVPEDLKNGVRALDRFQTLCVWIPVDPKKPVREDIPGMLELAARVEAFTAGRAPGPASADPPTLRSAETPHGGPPDR